MSRKGADAFQDLELSKEFYDHCMKDCFLEDINRIMLARDQKSEWEELIAGSIYWCAEAQDEYNLDVSFFKFWTAIETLIPSSRGEKVTENVLNGATVLYICGIINHGETEFVKYKKDLSNLYEKRSNIVHNGENSKINPEDLSKICKYASYIVLNSIFWYYKGHKRKKQVKKSIERLTQEYGLIKMESVIH